MFQTNNMILFGAKTLSVRPSTTGNTNIVRVDIFGGVPGSSLGSSTLYVSLQWCLTHCLQNKNKMFWSLFILWYMYVLFLFSSLYSTVSHCSISALVVQKTAGARPPRIIHTAPLPLPQKTWAKNSLRIAWLHQVPYSVFCITPSGPIYKRNLGQQSLMYLVKNLVQIH